MKGKRFHRIICLCSCALLLLGCFGSVQASDANVAEEGHSPLPIKECSAAESDTYYYEELLDAEIYNYKLLRNLPTAFDYDEWREYCSAGAKLLNITDFGESEESQELILNAYSARTALQQQKDAEDVMWYIWGDSMPCIEEDPDSLEFTVELEDSSDFRPYLLPYLLEDPLAANGNIIVIAGGGYAQRNNLSEGYPVAEGFNDLGYNAFVLQRRVSPYNMYDIFMDLQRAIRYIRYRGAMEGWGGMDTICATGFSGGSATIIGQIEYAYGDIQPTLYDSNYVSDEIDEENSDLDYAFLHYGPNPDMGSTGAAFGTALVNSGNGVDLSQIEETTFTGLVTDNENIPCIFMGVGGKDQFGANKDTLILAMDLEERGVTFELHYFANIGHGYGAGILSNNTTYWMEMADGFLNTLKIQKAADDARANR